LIGPKLQLDAAQALGSSTEFPRVVDPPVLAVIEHEVQAYMPARPRPFFS
jgi:hypothetical protein